MSADNGTGLIETAIRLPRIAGTLRDARRFSRIEASPSGTDGQSQFRMRSAMDLDPRIGKWMSRRVVQVDDPRAWALADPASSTLVDSNEIEPAVEAIRRDGFYVFAKVVDREFTDAIRTYAERVPSVARGAGTAAEVYPRSNPAVGRYDIAETDALGCPQVQEFVSDPAMARISQLYLGQPVIMDEVAFWWTTNRKSEDADVNAQLFHQDRDRLSFLKFFIYLTDVTPTTGPHVYVRGSHQRLPRSLRGDGRKTDEAVRANGLGPDITEICGPAGSLMAVDTIGLHKGKTPQTSDRLALENEFATSLFGADFERPTFTPTPLMRERMDLMPWVLQRYCQ